MFRFAKHRDKVSAQYDRGRNISIAFLTIVLATTIGFGLGSHLNVKLREFSYTFCSVVMFGGIIWLAAACLYQPKEMGGWVQTKRGMDAPWIVLCGFVCMAFYLSLATLPALALSAGLWLITVGLRLLRREPAWSFAISVVTMICLMAYTVHRMNLQPDEPGMDLLPITKAAIHFALRGIDPYQADYSGVTPNPFFYLPLEWLIYLPFEIVGINLRWVNFACWLIIIIMFEGFVLGRRDPAVVRLMFYPVVAAFPVFQAMDAQVLPMWLETTCFMVALLRMRLALAAFILGCLLATNQLMLVVAGMAVPYFLMTFPLRRFFLYAAITVCTMVIVIGPFILDSPGFVTAVFVERPRIANATWEAARNAYNSVGLNNLLYIFHLEMFRLELQFGLLIVGAITLLIRPPVENAQFLYVNGVVLLCAIALNGQILRYYYYPPFLMIAWGVGMSSDMARRWQNQKRSLSPDAELGA